MATPTPLKPRERTEPKEQTDELEKTGIQFRLYRNGGVKRGLGNFLVWFFGFFSVLYTAGLLYNLILFLLGKELPAQADEMLPFLIVANVGFVALTFIGFRLRRTGRRLNQELAELVEKEGNFYCCSCGQPMKTYGTIHKIILCLPPWGLIALFFKLKKCIKCGKPYPKRLLATR